MTYTHERGFSFLFPSQLDQIFFFVFSKLLKQMRWLDQPKWTDKDAEEFADKIKDHLVSESLLFENIWRSRTCG